MIPLVDLGLVETITLLIEGYPSQISAVSTFLAR